MDALNEPLSKHIVNVSVESESPAQQLMVHFNHCPCYTPAEDTTYLSSCDDEDETSFDQITTQPLLDPQSDQANTNEFSFDHIGSLGQTSSDWEESFEDVADEVAPLHLQLCVCRFDLSPGANAESEELVTYIRECLRKASDSIAFLKQLEDTHLSDYQEFLAQVMAASGGVIATLTRRWMRKVAEATGVLPRSLFIEQLRVDGKHPVAIGGFASVYKGVVNDKPVALKVLRYISEECSFPKEFYMEVLVWHQLENPHILPLLGMSLTAFEKQLCLVSPWMKHGHIRQYLSIRPKFIPTKLLHQVSLGLNYLHTLDPPLVHGDIKAVNVLINEKEEVYIADFGLISVSETCTQAFATTRDTRASDGAGTVRWMAPEMHKPGTAKSREGDVYAFGMTMLEVFTDRVPYCDIKNDVQVMFSVASGELPPRPEPTAARGLSDEIWLLIKECWQSTGERPDSEQLSRKLQCLILPEQPGDRDIRRREEDDGDEASPSVKSRTPRKRDREAAPSPNSRVVKKLRLAVNRPSNQQPDFRMNNNDSPQRPLSDKSEITAPAGKQVRASLIPPHQQHSDRFHQQQPQPQPTRISFQHPAPSASNPKKRSSNELAANSGGGSSNDSSPIASPSTLASPSWINPYTGMTSSTTNAQPFYHPQQQQHDTLPSSPLYNHRSTISPSSSSHYSNSASPYSHPFPVPSTTSAVTSLQIRVNNSQGIQIPLTPSSSTSGQGITVTTVSPSSVTIRLLVPPHSSPLAHLQNANISAVIGVRIDVFSWMIGRMIGNQIWADGRALGEEIDLFEVKSSSSSSSSSAQIVAPLRLTGGMLLGRNVGVLTIQQTIYGPPRTPSYPSSTSSSALLTINYELVRAAHPSLPQQQPSYGMNYGGMGGGAGYSNGSLGSAWVSNASAWPFTQF